MVIDTQVMTRANFALLVELLSLMDSEASRVIIDRAAEALEQRNDRIAAQLLRNNTQTIG